ncbi:MAG: DUF1573 domain-containing protein [Calditrichaeota bacterium]|nr:DUF1573 domain-containing protein [Calditrichota bacterium]
MKKMLMLMLMLMLPAVLTAQPRIEVEPQAIEFGGMNGEVEENILNIANTGDEILFFTIILEIINEPDGNRVDDWVTFEPDDGALAPGEDLDVVVTLSRIGLIEGIYEANLQVRSNDPTEPQVDVNVTLQTNGIPPVLMLEWDEVFGYPDIIDWNQGYLDVFPEVRYPVELTVTNDGDEMLAIEDIVADNEAFVAEPSAFELEPGAQRVVTVSFSGEEVGNYEGTMHIISNNVDREIAIPLHAVASGPPRLIIDPMSIEDDIDIGDVREYNVSITNGGEGALRWGIGRIIVIREPGGAEGIEWITATRVELGLLIRVNSAGCPEGQYEADIFITSNDPARPEAMIGMLFDFYRLGVPGGRSASPPTTLILGVPFPNPFNGRTTLWFGLPAPGEAQLAVFDLTGREVARLAGGRFDAGWHRADWEAPGNIAAGVYLARLSGSGGEARAKAVLVR